MELDNAQTYLTGVGDQLAGAVARRDVEAVGRILDQVDADGYPQAAVILAQGVARTSLGPAMAEPPLSTTEPVDVITDNVMADALRVSVERIIELSRWINAYPPNRDRDPEALNWVRVSKTAEEAGEAIEALTLAVDSNPRKPAGGMARVNKELLDVALTALGAYEHLNGHLGFSMAALFGHIEAVHGRAELDNTESPA